MSDIYRELAAGVTGKPAEQVTDAERALAKDKFWAALTQVAQLPGNGALQAALRSFGSEGLQFANFEWQPRWNTAEAVASYSQDGAAAFATGFFGVLRFRLDDPGSCTAIANSARRFAEMVEQAAEGYAVDVLGG